MKKNKTLEILVENGFDITQIEPNKYLVVDNGKFGFCMEENPFIVDEDELLEIYKAYIN
jgi:hypothetical protein